MYGVAVMMLINVLRDGKIEMMEALYLVLAYVFYILSEIKNLCVLYSPLCLNNHYSDVFQRQGIQVCS